MEENVCRNNGDVEGFSGSIFFVLRGLVIGCLVAIIWVQNLRRKSNDDEAMLFPKKELEILHESSMDVTRQLFDNLEEDPLGGEYYPGKDVLLQLLQLTKTPEELESSINEDYYHREEKLRVLGGAIWFRFHFRGGITVESLQTLIQTQHDHFNNLTGKSNYTTCTASLNNLRDIILWAAPFEERELMVHCLYVLAWVFRKKQEEENPTMYISALPERVVTLLLLQVIESYHSSSFAGSIRNCLPESEEPELVPTGDNQTTEKSTKSISKSTTKYQARHYQQAKRICGYLHLLNVLIVSPPKENGLADSDDEADEATTINSSGSTARSNTLIHNLKLRPGILKVPETFPQILSRSSIEMFLKRLIEQLDVSNISNAINPNQELQKIDNSLFLLQQMPTLALQLRSYAQAIQLLFDNPDLTKARLKYLGVLSTVRLYLQEWTQLQKSLQDSLLVDYTKDKPPDSSASSSLAYLINACLSSTATDVPADNPKPIQQQHLEIARACYQLGVHLPATNDVPLALQLLSQARRHQLLALEQQCHHVSNSLHNLAKTLWAREGVSNNLSAALRTSNNLDDEYSAPPYPPEKYHALSLQLLENIHRISQEYGCDEDQTISENTLISMVLMLTRHLSRILSAVKPLLRAHNIDEKERPSNEWKLPLCTLTGMAFRQYQIQKHFQVACDIIGDFADTQKARCRLPCNIAEVQSTEHLLGALRTFQRNLGSSDHN